MNLVLKPVGKGNLEWLLRYRNDPTLNVNFNQPSPLSMDDQIGWYENQVLTKKAFAYIVYLGDMGIGYIALQNINWITRSAEVSHFIIGDFDQANFAMMAHEIILNHGFNSLNLHRIHSACFGFNGVKDTLIKLGFKVEGVLRDHCFKLGKYHDSYLLSMLESEYDPISTRL